MSTLDNPVFEQKPVSKWPLALRWGIIGGLGSAAVSMIWHVAGWSSYGSSFSAGNFAMMPVNWAVILGALVMGMKQHRDETLGGHITFGEGFNTGILITLVMSAVSAVFMVVFFKFVAPDVLVDVMEKSRSDMEDRGMDDEAVEQAMKFASFFASPLFFAITGFISKFFGGLILSLIGAAIVKKDTPTSI